jgi:hypothetical protein
MVSLAFRLYDFSSVCIAHQHMHAVCPAHLFLVSALLRLDRLQRRQRVISIYLKLPEVRMKSCFIPRRIVFFRKYF